ncbi:MAG: response regulator [Saprospiraceae bacterium]|nr:response regulator [Saprospiraceae bacterium]
MKKILVIEDNNDVRENIAEILTLANYEVETAENGKVGLVKVNQFKPDLILCDVMMPELDGYGVLKILASNPQFATVPFIFLTAKAEKVDLRKGMSLGASDYITKPFDDADLLESIQVRLRRSDLVTPAESNHMKSLDAVPSNYFNEKLKAFSQDFELRRFRKKDIIFEEGNNARYIYFLEEGKVRVFRTNEFGKELTTRIVNGAEVLGFLDVLNSKPYSKSAQSLEESTIRMIPVKNFIDLFYTDRDFSLSLMKHLAVYAGILETGLVHQAYSSVRRKVANALIQCYEKNEANPVITMMRDDLASIAGTAKETVIRTLSDFKHEGIIDIEETDIFISNVNALINMPQ